MSDKQCGGLVDTSFVGGGLSSARNLVYIDSESSVY